VKIRNRGRIGQGWIAGPEPDEAVTLGHRIAAHTGGGIDRSLGRHEGAAAGGVEDQTMIAAHHLVALELAQ
jgi:hypothetical protein